MTPSSSSPSPACHFISSVPYPVALQITLPHEPEALASSTRTAAAIYLACGVDPSKVWGGSMGGGGEGREGRGRKRGREDGGHVGDRVACSMLPDPRATVHAACGAAELSERSVRQLVQSKLQLPLSSKPTSPPVILFGWFHVSRFLPSPYFLLPPPPPLPTTP